MLLYLIYTYIMKQMPFEAKVNPEQLISSLRDLYGNKITSAHIKAYCAQNDVGYQTVTKYLKPYKKAIGKWNLTVAQKLEETYNKAAAAPAIQPQNLIPTVDPNFVKFGNFPDVKKIIQSKQFYPCFITGLSGNGKTLGVEQACAQLKREVVRVNITIETDEDDLIGGFRLVNGSTVWHNGPVIEALARGAILLLDEIDLASNKILCLQSILEGNGVFLKKIGRFVRPAKGFNIFATANTKGKGSEDGRFIGTNVLNEAFLERFPVTFEQSYPSVKTEEKILNLLCDDKDLCKRLVDWGDIIRKTFYDGGVEEVISTRRLVHIVKAYSIWKNKEKAIEVCVNRFDDETKQAFLDLYDKGDADVNFEGDTPDEPMEELQVPSV